MKTLEIKGLKALVSETSCWSAAASLMWSGVETHLLWLFTSGKNHDNKHKNNSKQRRDETTQNPKRGGSSGDEILKIRTYKNS